ncbi:Por secretion system C-terminal sorting domain-containing protein [Algibacter pectinivorans]|uniref:Por secretion system C-terminal sorting domain-containing protein n=1 Tax=Algibacter pectinivorans TaxID=870482 RepID=A0A1I1N834_9FLAO|nr:Por secretion system C-terminal sorting domain-containing protein [Algibacter pectinivorans]
MLLKKILFLSFFLFSFVSSSFSTTISNLELYNVNGSTSSSAATCSNNGTITVTATGSNINPSLYIFTITNGPTSNGQTYPFPNQFHESTFTFIDLYPGTYEVTVEDAGDPSNPSFTGSVTVLDETELLNFTTSSTAPSCPGESNGSISVNVLDGVGPYQYQIIDGPIGTTTVPISDSSANYTFNNLPSGDYRIRVFDVCGDFQTRNRRINTSSSPSVNLRGNGVNRISCTEAIYSVDVFGSGSYTYEIVGGAPSGYASSNTTGNFTLPINQAPYTFSVTGNCGQTDTYTYNNPTNGVSFFVLDKGCAGFDLSLNPRWMYGPYTYTLTNTPAGYTGPLTNTTGDFDDLPFGDYEYTVTDSCGSVFSGANNETFAAVEIDPSTDAEGDTCNVGLGSVVISYNSNDAPGPVSFELTTVPASFMGDPGPKNGNVFNELTVGNYVVTATDACGNTDTHAFEFEEADALDVTFDISVVQGCVNDHSVQVNTTTNTSGGFGFRRYRLRDVSTGIQRGSAAAFFGPATFSNVAPGEYYIEYDFFSGCGIDSEPFTVEAYEQPRLTPLSSYTCANNGLVTISGVTEGGVGPFSYSLINTANNQILATSTECYFNNQDAALAYTVRIEDNCGNSSSAQVSPVAVGLGLEFQGETCAPLGESFPFYLRAYNGVNYDWSFPDGSTFNGNDPRAIIGTVSNSDYGVYTIIASTNDGCRTQELSIDFESCPLPPVHLDFDGVDDYLSGDSILNGLNEVTLMAWVKIDPSNAGVSSVTIAGEDISCRIYVQNGNRFMFGTRTTAGSTRATNGVHVNYNEWHHITGVFNGVTGEQTIYIDGERSTSSINTSQIGQTILCTASWTGDFEIGRLSRNVSNQEYFNGEIDEVRVFNKALTETQIQRMVYQEIENNSGFVKGTVINKDIEDDVTGLKINWSTLLAYYPMTNIVNSATLDYSGNNRDVLLNNITTVQEQTAPMPYESVSDGNWTDESTWLHGDVWDIEDTATNKDWSIVHIKHDVNADHSVKNLGLFIDENKTLEVAPDNEVNNSWYLELNGTLNLLGDSQLVQGTSSDLVTSAQGNILRRQEGTASPFRYNYWSSPVGSPLETNVTTAFTDNEEGVNNPNNTSFMLNTIKDDRGTLFSFTNTYNEIGKISTYWLYTYQNGLSYWNWTALSPSTPLQPGIGYTQKGTGNGGAEQQYIFDGKPNNGTILVEVDDVGGPGSVSDVSRTGYLLGNPYPSAIDIHKFIDDNIGVIGDENSPSGGFVQIWQQWSGSSHVLTDYIGGYAKVNKTGSIRASQFIGLSGDNTGNREGTLAPTRYLPVGQGFVVEIVANNAQINFNNGQRIYRKEGDATIFLKSTTKKSPKLSASKQKEDENLMQKIRLEFNTVKGPETRQELLLGFSDFTTDGFDYGYDAKSTEESHDYLNLDFEGQNMHIQAYGTITKEKVVPFNFRSSGENTFEIKLTKLDNIPEDQAIYLRDNETDIYFDLTKNQEYNFTSKQGVFNNRFELVFQSKQEVLSTEEAIAIKNYVYFQNKTNTLFVKKLNSNVSKLSLINMRGQVVLEMADVTIEQLENGIVFNTISTGAYVVYIRTETNEVLNKKIIVN